jgi:hypothetical protein
MNFEIEAVEYPVDDYPPKHIQFDYNEGLPNFLRLLVDDEPDSNELVRIWWNGPHTCNDTVSTVPKKHDWIISLGCEGYALLLRAVQEANNVISDMASLRTLVGTTLSFTDAETALALVATELGLVGASFVTPDFTAAETAIAAGVPDIAATLALAEGVWADEVDHLTDSGGTDVEAATIYLTAGQARLNKFNKGREVPQQYALFVEKALEIASHWAKKREDFLTEAQRQVDAAGAAAQAAGVAVNQQNVAIQGGLGEAQRHIDAAHAAAAAAAQWIQEQSIRTQQAQSYIGNITQGVLATQMYRQDGLERIGRFKDALKDLKMKGHSRQKSQLLGNSIWEND